METNTVSLVAKIKYKSLEKPYKPIEFRSMLVMTTPNYYWIDNMPLNLNNLVKSVPGDINKGATWRQVLCP